MHDRPASCLCLTVSHRPSRRAGRMALQKLLMLSYEQRSPSASRRASWTTTVSRTTGSERRFALPVHACRYGPCGCFGEGRGEAVCGAHDVWSSVGSRWIHRGRYLYTRCAAMALATAVSLKCAAIHTAVARTHVHPSCTVGCCICGCGRSLNPGRMRYFCLYSILCRGTLRLSTISSVV